MKLELSDNEKLALISYVIHAKGWGDKSAKLNRIKEICNDE